MGSRVRTERMQASGVVRQVQPAGNGASGMRAFVQGKMLFLAETGCRVGDIYGDGPDGRNCGAQSQRIKSSGRGTEGQIGYITLQMGGHSKRRFSKERLICRPWQMRRLRCQSIKQRVYAALLPLVVAWGFAQPARWSRRLLRVRSATACARLAGS